MGFTISTRKEATVEATLVKLSGDLDGKTTPLIQEQVLPLATDNCKLILDMSHVEYMSSAGLRMLLAVRRQMAANGYIVLVGLSEAIKDTMTITGFLDFFTTCDTIEDGIQALAD